jgi:hypothetical protein
MQAPPLEVRRDRYDKESLQAKEAEQFQANPFERGGCRRLQFAFPPCPFRSLVRQAEVWHHNAR